MNSPFGLKSSITKSTDAQGEMIMVPIKKSAEGGSAQFYKADHKM